jgi:hypothetical protein
MREALALTILNNLAEIEEVAASLAEPGKSGILKGFVPLVKKDPISALRNIYSFVQTPVFDLRNPRRSECRCPRTEPSNEHSTQEHSATLRKLLASNNLGSRSGQRSVRSGFGRASRAATQHPTTDHAPSASLITREHRP